MVIGLGLVRTGLVLGLAVAAFLGPGCVGSAGAAPQCPATPPAGPMSLPHLKAAIAKGEQGIIVAIGSSSTQGVMATDPGRSYPAELQDLLSAALPERHIAVINRGIGGQDARREYARLNADVIAVRPQLVIWQVGANAALRAEDIGLFRGLVAEGVRELQAAAIDVVLMDNQRSPRILAATKGAAFDLALADIAQETGATLFSRDRLMAGWAREGAALERFVARDGLHHNDLGYRCVAQALATDILAVITPPALSASR